MQFARLVIGVELKKVSLLHREDLSVGLDADSPGHHGEIALCALLPVGTRSSHVKLDDDSCKAGVVRLIDHMSIIVASKYACSVVLLMSEMRSHFDGIARCRVHWLLLQMLREEQELCMCWWLDNAIANESLRRWLLT
jgi:hypothetical protein